MDQLKFVEDILKKKIIFSILDYFVPNTSLINFKLFNTEVAFQSLSAKYLVSKYSKNSKESIFIDYISTKTPGLHPAEHY